MEYAHYAGMMFRHLFQHTGSFLHCSHIFQFLSYHKTCVLALFFYKRCWTLKFSTTMVIKFLIQVTSTIQQNKQSYTCFTVK